MRPEVYQLTESRGHWICLAGSKLQELPHQQIGRHHSQNQAQCTSRMPLLKTTRKDCVQLGLGTLDLEVASLRMKLLSKPASRKTILAETRSMSRRVSWNSGAQLCRFKWARTKRCSTWIIYTMIIGDILELAWGLVLVEKSPHDPLFPAGTLPTDFHSMKGLQEAPYMRKDCASCTKSFMLFRCLHVF